ncbi:MAG: nucleotide sugar dehydrogenase [Proteobacteria bacterium]|nr:nucleotide sugar dehydrogenase [Pseudomonadota bacterium]
MTQQTVKSGTRRIAVVGLGYVGLPVAIAFAEKFPGTIGFDISARRVNALRAGEDWTGEIESGRLKNSGLHVTSNAADMGDADVFIVCVPTPIHEDRRPDLTPLQSASQTVGKVLRKGGVVVYESTVYPGLTEEVCGPIVAKSSGLKQGVDFKLGYSPERINPGDKEHSFEKIKKVVAGEDDATTDLLCELYASVVTAGVHRAPSIKVAEAAKVLENTQRDLNIALMNELAIICDLLGIRTKDVLDAAGTKWNFLKFSPGLVGGHCIGVDPYYLTSKAQELGYHPEVILAGRRINDTMAAQIAQRLVRSLSDLPRPLREAKVSILGITFKENVPDIRNSKIPDIVRELRKFGIEAHIDDPLADRAEVTHEYGLNLCGPSALKDCDALVLAVPHRSYLQDETRLWSMLRDGGVLVDIKSAINPGRVPRSLRYWSL